MNAYTVDRPTSEINYTVKFHNTHVKGTFESYSPSFFIHTLEELSTYEIEVEIDVASLTTNEPIRDHHLRSADFFHADKYPKIYFKKTSLIKQSTNYYELTGDITIKNITQPITFNVKQMEAGALNSLTTYICTTKVNRNDFELVYNPIFEKINQLDEIVHIEVLFTVLPI